MDEILKSPKYIETTNRIILILKGGLAYMSGRRIYDGSFDSE